MRSDAPDGGLVLLDGSRAGERRGAGSEQDSLFTDAAALLALLPPDDPRAIFLRAGGRLDATGNPLPTASQRRAARARERAQRAYIPPEQLGWQPNAPDQPLDPLRPPSTQPAMPDPHAAPQASERLHDVGHSTPSPAPSESPSPSPSSNRTSFSSLAHLPDMPKLPT